MRASVFLAITSHLKAAERNGDAHPLLVTALNHQRWGCCVWQRYSSKILVCLPGSLGFWTKTLFPRGPEPRRLPDDAESLQSASAAGARIPVSRPQLCTLNSSVPGPLLGFQQILCGFCICRFTSREALGCSLEDEAPERHQSRPAGCRLRNSQNPRRKGALAQGERRRFFRPRSAGSPQAPSLNCGGSAVALGSLRVGLCASVRYLAVSLA